MMTSLHALIGTRPWLACLVLLASFTVLAKCADLFVDASVRLARRLRIPRLVVGLVLVSLATTAPELSVSLASALRGKPEMALGNAVGSVICNGGLALALCGLLAPAPIVVIPRIVRSSGTFLVATALIAFAMTAFDHTLGPWEGLFLLLLFAGYIATLYRQHTAGLFEAHVAAELEAGDAPAPTGLPRTLALFVVSLGGIILAGEFIVTSATTIARAVGVPDAVVALTMVALGTSIPEVATCVMAARRGHGDLAVGNILGANIMNICWVAGASALANPLATGPREIYFMFPAMLTMTGVTLTVMATRWRLTRREGGLLLGIYLAYLALSGLVFRM